VRYLIRIFAGVWLATLVVTAGFAAWEIRDDRARVADALRRRAALAAETLADASEPLVAREGTSAFARILRRFTTAERRIAVFDASGRPRAASSDLRPELPGLAHSVAAVLRGEGAIAGERRRGSRPSWVHVQPLGDTATPTGAAVVALDADELDAHTWNLGGRTAVRIGVLVLALTGILWLALRWTIVRPVALMAEWTKQLTASDARKITPGVNGPLFGPLAHEVAALAGTLARARASAAREARLRLTGERVWTEERLKQYVQLTFGARPIFVVSNREPVSHVRDGRAIRELQPASGLVTAIEPIMLACGGVWVAHGSGNADRLLGERVPLPTAAPTYTLRRVWLTEEEEAGYYYGFANEGLWPLCHIVHVRPQFRVSDWEQYRAVNRKFADALVHEIDGTKSPIVLVQDYHFALLPEMVKRARPDAQIALFWHIPWPNFEAFGICPWQDEILLGILGADLVGFHTQFHCNNFLDTVERSIEARVDWDHFAITRGRRSTHVFPFPISVATDAETPAPSEPVAPAVEFLGVGVERVDYTKGLPERFLAIRRFFERWPQYRRRVTFVQIAAPSREKIASYRDLRDSIDKLVATINAEIGDADWLPIDYRARHHSHAEIGRVYRAARFCMVTSLHDGMNLVAKEFVAARDDERGVLILSRFAGAARELSDALRVNPYDVESVAEAIRAAIEMSPDEERQRMRRMRHWVREHNVYRWTGEILARLSEMGGPEMAPQTPRPSERRG
jgi:trehalose 6-phosphate synthase